LKFIFGMF